MGPKLSPEIRPETAPQSPEFDENRRNRPCLMPPSRILAINGAGGTEFRTNMSLVRPVLAESGAIPRCASSPCFRPSLSTLKRASATLAHQTYPNSSEYL